VAAGVREVVLFGVIFGAKHDLGQSFAIAQIDENDPAMITPDMHPARKFCGTADVRGTELIAMMCPVHVAVRSKPVWG
jgi:hypothetical protein